MQPTVPHQPAGADVFSALEKIKKLALSRPAARGGLDRLRGGHIAVIAELGPAHPAASDLGNRYVNAGAAAIAVRADSSTAEPDSTARISAQVQAPMVSLEPAGTSYEIWRARACGADMVVLPAATLSDSALYSLLERAESIGMDAIVEVGSAADLVRALRARARGVLLRSTADAVSVDAASADVVSADVVSAGASVDELLLMVPDGVVKLAECGPGGRSGLISHARNGADAVVVGASLLAGADSVSVVADLVAIGAHPALSARGRRAA
ncbi:indole-3-glycerol phosphate synthase TrpC [Catenulispora yoronensis]|uniref:indole-3-glycerol-phosphate synthase n=1 Tax=Catenulispora yoronensis TaxID=450799 RepID=A0ABN2TJ05_9ACTN